MQAWRAHTHSQPHPTHTCSSTFSESSMWLVHFLWKKTMARSDAHSTAVDEAAATIEVSNLIQAATDRLTNSEGMPRPKARKALRQLCSQRCVQCVANEHLGAGGLSPGLQVGENRDSKARGRTHPVASTHSHVAGTHTCRCCQGHQPVPGRNCFSVLTWRAYQLPFTTHA